MANVPVTGAPAPESRTTRARFDRPVLVGNLISGGMCLVLLAFLGALVLSVIGAAYVLAASLFFAYFYARDSVTIRQEALAWTAPWLVAVALWTGIAAGFEGGTSSWLLNVWFGLVLGTGTFLAWQVVALAVRRVIAWQARTGTSRL